MPEKRWCPICDDMVVGAECPECGADTDPWLVDGRDRDDDDGLGWFSDPRDAREERRHGD